jgi:hypothetical protein
MASAVLALWVGLGRYWPVGADYYYTLRPVTDALIHGQTRLFEEPGFGFYNAPWTLLAVLPTLWLPLSYGQAALTLLVLVGLIAAVAAVQEGDRLPLIAVIAALANLHTFDTIVRGNCDGLSLLGLAFGWVGVRRRRPLLLGWGLWLLACKPINLIPAMLFLLWGARQWTRRQQILVLLPLALTLILSLPLLGWDWPLRYFAYAQFNPPYEELQTSLWRVFEVNGLPRWSAHVVSVIGWGLVVWRLRSFAYGREGLALVLSATMVFTPYALGSHYTLLAPVLVVLALRWRLSPLVWVLTLTPLARLWLGYGAAWIDIVYPVVLLLLAWRNRPQAIPAQVALQPVVAAT